MGKNKRKAYKDKPELVEYIYKNSILIDSLYSQLFKGDVTSYETNEGTSELARKNATAGAPGVLSGSIGSGTENQSSLKTAIKPLDDKINDLLNALDLEPIEKTALDGTLAKQVGTIEIFYKPLVEKNVPELESIGVFDELYSYKPEGMPGGPSVDQDDHGVKKLLTVCRNLMPEGMSMVFCSGNDEYQCLVEDQYFIIPPERLAATYGSNLPGEYVMAGIFSRNPKVTIEQIYSGASAPNVARAMFVFQQAPIHVLETTESELLFRPFLIYRRLCY